MYNTLQFTNRKTENRFEVLLTPSELNTIKHFISWKRNDDGFIDTSNDVFDISEVKKIKEVLIQLDFSFNKYHVYFYWAEELGIGETIEKLTPDFPIGPIKLLGPMVAPENGRPTIKYDSGNTYEWYEDLGVFKEIYTSKGKGRGFLNHNLTLFLSKTENDIKLLRKKIQAKKDKINSTKLMEKYPNKYIRVISVYDKDSKALKYRIINEDFFSYVHYDLLDPFEGDDLFFRSYKINKEMVETIKNLSDMDIDFDMDKNDYFFETVCADDFTYPYEEFIKDLELRNEE